MMSGSVSIFDETKVPSVEKYLQKISKKAKDDQESELKDPVTMDWINDACYIGGRLWEVSTVDTLRKQAISKGDPYWSHPLNRSLIPCSLKPIPSSAVKALIEKCKSHSLGDKNAAALNLDDVRRMASSQGLMETYFNAKSRVISFCDPDSTLRVNVYYTTGTVGTCLKHPRNMKLQDLDRIFANPRAHTGEGYYTNSTTRESHLNSTTVSHGPVSDEETALSQQINILEQQLTEYRAQMSSLKTAREEEEWRKAAEAEEARQKEEQRKKAAEAEEARRKEEQRKKAEKARKKAEKILQLLEDERQRRKAAAAEKKRQEKRGNDCDWWLFYHDDIPDMCDTSCVAIGEGGYVAVSDSGVSTYHGIPSNVQNYLDRQHNRNIAFVAIGPEDQYFVRKTNGKCAYNGPASFEEAMDDYYHSKGVSVVTFGPWGIWYVKYEDGSEDWRGIDENYGQRLSSILSTCPIRNLFLGDNGIYFVAYNESKISHRGMPTGVARKLSDSSISVKQVLLDEENNSWFVRFSDK